MKTRHLLKFLPPVAGVALLSGCFYAYEDAAYVPAPGPTVYTGVAVGGPLWYPSWYDGLPSYYYPWPGYYYRPRPPVHHAAPGHVAPPPPRPGAAPGTAIRPRGGASGSGAAPGTAIRPRGGASGASVAAPRSAESSSPRASVSSARSSASSDSGSAREGGRGSFSSDSGSRSGHFGGGHFGGGGGGRGHR
ncbi:MAG: hypothetical protein LBR05_05090 [Azoarcus sp.]|jgi:hypothetical protein|nr:hypothetical protein [Azoarcus sp.]